MLLLRGYKQWCGIAFLVGHFRVIWRGRKLYVIVLVCVGSSFVVLCCGVLVCGRKILFLVLCRKLACLSWEYWFRCWGHWPGYGYNEGRRWLNIASWSWFVLDTLWTDRVPWKTLNEWSGCLPLCVKIPVYILQRRVCLTWGIWLSFKRWFLFFDALYSTCSLVCHALFLGMGPVRW